MSVEIPHFALPFRFAGGSAVEVEQGTLDEVVACVEAIVRTPLGSVEELPEFGIPEQTFLQGGPDQARIRTAIARWEPRASVSFETPDPQAETLTARLGIRVDLVEEETRG